MFFNIVTAEGEMSILPILARNCAVERTAIGLNP